MYRVQKQHYVGCKGWWNWLKHTWTFWTSPFVRKSNDAFLSERRADRFQDEKSGSVQEEPGGAGRTRAQTCQGTDVTLGRRAHGLVRVIIGSVLGSLREITLMFCGVKFYGWMRQIFLFPSFVTATTDWIVFFMDYLSACVSRVTCSYCRAVWASWKVTLNRPILPAASWTPTVRTEPVRMDKTLRHADQADSWGSKTTRSLFSSSVTKHSLHHSTHNP